MTRCLHFTFLVLIFWSLNSYATIEGNTIYVSPSGGSKSFENRSVLTLTLKEALGKTRPGTIIQLLPGIYTGETLLQKGGNPDRPLIMRGLGKTTIFDGRQKPSDNVATCIKIDGADWIQIEDLAIKNCWPIGIHIHDSRYISVRKVNIIGSRHAIFASGKNTHHILIEESRWVQDPSGALWKTIPWAEAHHGKFRFFNGAMLGAKKIKGSVVFRRNTISHAFNGVRLEGDRENPRTDNANVEIYENYFEYIRDNPIEPERSATNWWIHHNKIRNGFALFSFMGLHGGHWYVFRNIAWFDDKPGAFGGHARGKIFKFEAFGPYPTEPFYVFHNSWYTRSPLIAGGETRNFFHWNNAIHFSRKVGFLEEAAWHQTYHFDHDISNLPFTKSLVDAGQEKNGFVADPLFKEPRHGNFKLSSSSPAIDNGKIVTIGDWSSRFSGKAPDIGAFEGDKWLKGPPFKFRPTGYEERPRIVDWDFRADNLEIFFSVPMKENKRLAVHLEIKGNSFSSQDCALRMYSLKCKFPQPNLITVNKISKILLPTKLTAKNGKKITLWASPSEKLELYVDTRPLKLQKKLR